MKKKILVTSTDDLLFVAPHYHLNPPTYLCSTIYALKNNIENLGYQYISKPIFAAKHKEYSKIILYLGVPSDGLRQKYFKEVCELLLERQDIILGMIHWNSFEMLDSFINTGNFSYNYNKDIATTRYLEKIRQIISNRNHSILLPAHINGNIKNYCFDWNGKIFTHYPDPYMIHYKVKASTEKKRRHLLTAWDEGTVNKLLKNSKWDKDYHVPKNKFDAKMLLPEKEMVYKFSTYWSNIIQNYNTVGSGCYRSRIRQIIDHGSIAVHSSIDDAKVFGKSFIDATNISNIELLDKYCLEELSNTQKLEYYKNQPNSKDLANQILLKLLEN